MNDAMNLEHQFISLLLKNKDLVEDYIDSQLSQEHFDSSFTPILYAIEEAYQKDVLLTRKSFLEFINNFVESNKKKAVLELNFGTISFVKTDRNDYPMLKEKILNGYLVRSVSSSIQLFSKERENRGAKFAVQQLASRTTDLAMISQDKQKKIVYQDINFFTDDHLDHIENIREGKVKQDEKISFGIEELDKTSGVGLRPGTLTLFCGDVGGYKCGYYKNTVQCADGRRIPLDEIHQMLNRGESIVLQQYKEKSGKLVNKNILASYFSGKKECYKIRTLLGHEIISTANHRHRLFSGYKKTKDITIGSHVAVVRHLQCGEKIVPESEAFWVGMMLAEGGTTEKSNHTFTNIDPDIVKSMKLACKNLGGSLKRTKGRRGCYKVRTLQKLAYQYSMIGKKSINKYFDQDIFKWHTDSLKYLLKGMFSGDGSFSVHTNQQKIYIDGSFKRKYKIIYSTSSNQLAKDVRDILLRFGIVASIYEFETYCTNCKRKIKTKSWRVEISDVKQILKFIEKIGFVGKKRQLCLDHLSNIKSIKSNPNRDIIPSSIWSLIKSKYVDYNKTHTGCRRFYRRNVWENWKKDMGHCGNINKSISRECLAKIASYLNNDSDLLSIAESDIYWDKVVSIDYFGEYPTYDLSMPDDNNFVSNNIITHNSTMMLNIGANVWWNGNYNVLLVPLEMPREQMLNKLISRQTSTPFDLLDSPSKMTDKQINVVNKIVRKDWKNHEAKFWIMDSYEDRTKVSVIRHMIERNLDLFKPRLVIVDYIANLQPDKVNTGRNDLDIGDMLKDLRHMGRPGVIHEEGFAIVSGAQLGREALKRYRRGGDNAAFHSEDIRGSHEYGADADTMYAQFIDDNQPDDKLMIFCVKSRYGKKTFPNGSNKAALDVKPEISLIRSTTGLFSGDDRDEVLQKAINDESQDLDFESIVESNDIDVDATFDKNIVSDKLDGDDPELW